VLEECVMEVVISVVVVQARYCCPHCAHPLPPQVHLQCARALLEQVRRLASGKKSWV